MSKKLYKLISTDLDGTIIDEKSDSNHFISTWNANLSNHLPLLCYNTGRMLEDTLILIEEINLPKPDYIISGVGTHIYDYNKNRSIKEFTEIDDEGWDINKIEQTISQLDFEIFKQPEHFQDEYKSSWIFTDADQDQIGLIYHKLYEDGCDIHLEYSHSKFLDILPNWANKGSALKWLLNHLGLTPEEVIVIGDSGNDNSMFLIKGINGIIVSNAKPELYYSTKHITTYQSETSSADGVVEGLIHFGIFSEGIQKEQEKACDIEYDLIPHKDEVLQDVLSNDQIELIGTAYKEAIMALKRNITPLGFSACSISDNNLMGTDQNYFSVWTRDGSITIIGSLSLIQDSELLQCQRKTINTIINNVTEYGQVPINVTIEDEKPEFSGVGGIGSIDSGLWFIVCLYEYFNKTHEIGLLREYYPILSRIMNWLSAHDCNNDSLIEIPEAADWTDLLGNRYNVLYDEVLWYRTNICFARLLGMLGKDEESGHYMRRAKRIKKEIQLNFWPSTKQTLYQTINFAEQQYSLGDARYLISQVTPYDFNWRCDVFGNILSFLYNIIDIEKANLAFQFMIGVGVNDPYPVVNLYPTITVGDQDWRSYYAVNLLNLPNHYHNGGIWPFIGGFWIRFISKLGFKNLALQELAKLSELNKRGIFNEWEFNEWAHGRTGRPMGKAYQAWSASEFINTYNCLKIKNL